MSSDQIQFDGDNSMDRFRSRAILGQAQTPKMIKFLIDKGIVKNEKTAGTILIAITVICIALMIYIFSAYVFVNTNQKNGTPDGKLIPIEY